MTARRILIVDDEVDIRTIAAMALDAATGFDVRTCGSGFEAIAIAKNWAPELILLDYRMPDMNGLGVLDRLAEGTTATIPVAFFTASVMPVEREKLLNTRAVAVIDKPFDPFQLSERVQSILPPKEASDREAEDLFSLLYVSRKSLSGMDPSVINKIVAVAKENNSRIGISGSLVSTNTLFAQYLEGPRTAVINLVKSVEKDDRHTDLRVVLSGAAARRLFSGWDMAYAGASVFIEGLLRKLTSDPEEAAANKLIWLMREFTNDTSEVASNEWF